MDRNGFISMIALWILTIATVLALSLTKHAKVDLALSRTQHQQAMHINKVVNAIEWAHQNNFSFIDHQVGSIHMQVSRQKEEGALILLCHQNDKKVETGWKRTGHHWRLFYWKELTS